MPSREVLTVGHSTHPIERFIELLQGSGVQAVADVRRYPGSRRNPQFGSAALAASLARHEIAYEAFGEQLGGRRGTRDLPPPPGEGRDNSAWRNPSFRAYADYMSQPPFIDGLERLEALADARRTAIMCAEAYHARCHRQLIADALLAREWHVIHLQADGRLTDHVLTGHAVREGRIVFYPGPPTLDV